MGGRKGEGERDLTALRVAAGLFADREKIDVQITGWLRLLKSICNYAKDFGNAVTAQITVPAFENGPAPPPCFRAPSRRA